MSSEASCFLIGFPSKEKSGGAVNSEPSAQAMPSFEACPGSEQSEPIIESSEEKLSGRADEASGESSDELLLAQTANGSRDALGLLFRRHRRAVWSVARRILQDETEAEDLCQDVFVLLFQRARSFDSSRGTASSWIIQIAYHRAMNRRQYLAHRQHYNTQEIDEEQIGARHQPIFTDEITARNLLNRLREQLTEKQRETLELHFFDGYSLGEIAEKTNQTFGNVRHHYYRGLERLRSNVFPNKTRR